MQSRPPRHPGRVEDSSGGTPEFQTLGSNLKCRELLDDLTDRVDDFGSGQRAVGGRRDDIERTFQQLFGMKSV